MTWASILFAGWLTLAWLPSGGLALYDNPMPELVVLDGSFYTELGDVGTLIRGRSGENPDVVG